MNNYDNLHALVVFCNYPNDHFTTGTCLLNYWQGHPITDTADKMPNWAQNIICPDTNNIWNPTLTGYFRASSMGKFWLTGDVYPDLYVFEHPVSFYADSDKKMGYAVKELLENIDGTGNIDWSKYDNFDPYDLDNDGNRREPDGIVDFIFIVFRFTGSSTVDPDGYGRGYSGIACLGGRDYCFGSGVSEITTQDGHRILADFPGSGCIGMMTNPWELGIISHEFGEHYSYGVGHSENMGKYNINGGGIASAYDREHNGWNTTNAITPTSNTMGIELRDYVTTNDYIKIQRQNGNILYIENRKKVNYYSSDSNVTWKWQCTEPKAFPIQSDSMLVIYTNTGSRQFKIESAFGNYNWKKCSDNSFKTLFWVSSRYNSFARDIPNRSGLSTFDLHDISVSTVNCNFIASQTGYFGSGGDSNSCFDVEYNEIYSPWSNPPLSVYNQNDSLTIEIAGKNSSGNLLVNVYFTNITDAKPSKPQGLQIGWSECTNGVKYPKIYWEHNLEPDMIRTYDTDYKRYRIYRAYSAIGNNNEPGTFSILAERNLRADTVPVYIDYYASMDCGSLDTNPVAYNVWYKVQAVDDANLYSTLSDYVSTQTLNVSENNEDKLTNSKLPKSFSISQNYPNPFNPVTNIKFAIPKDVFVSIKIYDLLGREIKTLVNEYKNAGSYIVSFNGSEFASGIYFYRIQTESFINVKRMVLIK